MVEKHIGAIVQGFYGNRTHIEITEDEIDRMLQGIMNCAFDLDYEANRTIIRIPHSDCVLVYNKHQEADYLKEVHRWRQEEGYNASPLAFVPEKNIEIYSRCMVCRMNDAGEFDSVQKDDCDVIFRYLAH